MTGRLQKEIQQTRPFDSAQEEAFLNLQRTGNALVQAVTRFLKTYRLTPTQYNVLRILRGAHPNPLTCGDIGERLVTPDPDVTRLLDRLEKRDLVSRSRDTVDRRVVRGAITDEGLELLAGLDDPLPEFVRDLLGHLDGEELETLISLLEKARERVS